MKLALVQRILCLLLAAFVLFSSFGHGVVEHYCLMKGKSCELLLIGQEGPTGCTDHTVSPAGPGTYLHKTPCCKDTRHFRCLTPQSQTPDTDSQLSPAAADAGYGSFEPIVRGLVPALVLPPRVGPPDDAPTRSGRFRLARFCVWRI